MNQKVLITGISGFLGLHTCILALNKGYEVVGTVRDIKKADHLRSIIQMHSVHLDKLTIMEAELEDAHIWQSILEGIDFVLHIASPFPRKMPKTEEELIRPAREGSLNVLKAAVNNGVKKVVMTSSTGAIMYGKEKNERRGIFTEKVWSDINKEADITPYFKSKTIAEKSAWEFAQQHEDKMQFITICPGAILGPVLEKDFGTSANIVLKMMEEKMPAVPNIGFDVVDVRDVAELHLLAMESEFSGERYMATVGFLEFKEVANLLKDQYPQRKIPRGVLPNFLVRWISYIEKELKPILIDLGSRRQGNSKKAKQQLNWKPRSPKEAVISCAESLIEQGLV